MRSDLNKQLCEHERYGSSNGFSEVRHNKNFEADTYYTNEDREDSVGMLGHSRESMKHRYAITGRGKEFSENFAPLWGAIRKNVGRPWDKVYSDICKVFDKRSVINQHILLHLFDFVETKTYLNENNNVMIRMNYGSDTDLHGGGEYYVHPRTGLLCKNKFYRNYKHAQRVRQEQHIKAQLEVIRKLDDATNLEKLDGVWYECKYELIIGGKEYKPQRVRYGYGASASSSSHTHTYMSQVTTPDSKQLINKRTLSKKELMIHGCRND